MYLSIKTTNKKIKKHIFIFFIISGYANLVFYSHAQSTSDFSKDIQNGLAETFRSKISNLLSTIKSQDNKSSWDEFGINTLVNGESSPAMIHNEITADIINDLSTQLSYDQTEEQYLKLRNSTPEEIIATEGDGGNDLLPEDYVEPHPSLDANPDANPSALDVPIATDTLEALFTPSESTSTSTYKDNLVPPEGNWTLDDINTFKAILNIDDNATTTSNNINADTNIETFTTTSSSSTSTPASTDTPNPTETSSSTDITPKEAKPPVESTN